MNLPDRIIAYITACNGRVGLEKLIAKSQAVGFSEAEVLQALDQVGKRLKATVLKGQVYYQVPPPPKPTITSHLTWVTANYPRPEKCRHGVGYTGCEYCMPFPSINYDFMFLKTKDERDAFLAELKGRPAVYNKKRYAQTN